MVELKTLKDLEKDLEWKYDTLQGLKAEAIKWAKYYKSEGNDLVGEKFKEINRIRMNDCASRIAFIKMFFGLNEEDLR